jgi:hypothetical protein
MGFTRELLGRRWIQGHVRESLPSEVQHTSPDGGSLPLASGTLP